MVFVYLHKYGGKFMGTLYENIQNLCQRDGIKPGRLCEQLGLSRGLITDLKMGRTKSLNAQTAQKIAGYFGVSVGYLLGQEDASAPQNDILDDIDVAFYGEFKELDEQEKETIRDMVRLMRRRRTENQRD